MKKIKVGQLIQHTSRTTGMVYEVVQRRCEFDDFIAISLESDPIVVPIINQDNWAIVHQYKSKGK